MTFRPTRILAVLTFGLGLTLLFPGYATGQPTTDIRAKAAQLEKDLNAANQQVAALGQQLQAAQAKVDEADARVKVAQDGINRIKSMINGRAASIYKLAGAAGPFDALNAQDAQDITTRSKYTDLANSSDESLVEQLAASRAELDKARAEVTAERDAVAAAKAEADSAASTQQKLLDQVKGDIEAELRSQTASRAARSAKGRWSGAAGERRRGRRGRLRAGAGGQAVLQHRRAVRARLLRLLGPDHELLAGGRPRHPDGLRRPGVRVSRTSTWAHFNPVT